MTNINKAIGLTSYLVSLPPTPYLLSGMILLGLVFGIVINAGQSLQQAAFDGLMLLTFPALLSSFVIKILIRRMPYRRIAGTALGGEIVYSIAYGTSLLLAGVNPLWAQLVMLVGSALVFVLWYVIARFIFILKYRSILFAMIQLLFYLFFLTSTQAFYVTSEPFFDFAAKFYLSSFVLLAALVIFFFIINAPMKKNFGIRSTDAMSYFFSQWFYHNKDMENAFQQVGEPVKTIVSLMSFKRKNDSVFFVTPYVHFGPFGNLGGSEFSHLIAEEMDRKHKSKTFVFHGTVTHDLNPVSTTELKKITGALDSSLKKAVYKDAKVSISTGSADECRAQALRVNKSAMVSLTRAPKLTEDINFGLGLSLIFEAQKQCDNAMVVDQHNSETGEITSFEPGSLIGYRYLSALRKSLSSKPLKKPLKVGVAFRSVESDVVGSAGVKVAVFSSSPSYAIVLVDSNGVTPRFRDRIENEVKKELGKDSVVGVFTTDTHETNMVRGVLNPLDTEKNLVSAVTGATKDAVKDLQPAKFFAETKWFDIKVIGAKQSIELISTVNSIIAVAKITLPLIIIGAILLLVAISSKF
jgi:putative membrane protein